MIAEIKNSIEKLREREREQRKHPRGQIFNQRQ